MAVNFVARKCTQCAGKLQYIKEKKLWRCMYCGAEIEREEQYDGLFTIKNVVRQSLLDTSYRRLDSASKNIIECEKIDSRYVGTLIAKIAYEMITVITPEACSNRDSKNLFSQLKKNYEQLKNISASITDEEEALYEFFEEADIYATLVLVFDSLNDIARRDYVATLLNAKEVYSKAANANLLSYAIKNGQFGMADDIISNADNVDVKAAFSEIILKYPEGEKKEENVSHLFSTGALGYEDKPIVENYLCTTADSAETKSSILVIALNGGMKITLELIIDNVLKKSDTEHIESVVSAICKSKLSDEEVLRLVDFGFSTGSVDKAICVLDCLRRGEQYLLIPAKLLISLLNMESYTAQNKVCILKKCFEFKIDNKSLESVITNFLCYNGSSVQDRKVVLDCLFGKAVSFPTGTVETYVLGSTADGEEKPNVISAMFDKGLNVSFFNDLLSKYMNSNIDSGEIKSDVVNVLSEKGLKVDPGSFIDYICDSSDELPAKIQFIKRMLRNGSQLRGDATNTYLERTSPANFSAELFSLIFSFGSMFTAGGIEKYLLEMKDREANKVSNLRTIIEHSSISVSSLKHQIVHLGNPVSCNLLQAYILTTSDSEQLAFDIVDYFVNQKKVKINAEIIVSGYSMKFKKYIVANKEKLSDVSNAICEKYKVYTMLF